jgi:peptidoglycan/LPS O-acetylase OafA/YrhL
MISLIVSRIHGVVNKKSSANIQLDSLDGLRGFAVLLVVIAHAGYTGVISFSIYIWHVPLLAVIKRLPVELGWPFFIVLIAAVYIVSTLTYLLVEQPFLRMRLESVTQGVWLSKKTSKNKKNPTDDS